MAGEFIRNRIHPLARGFALGGLAWAVAGCSSIPAYNPPKLEVTAQFKEGAEFQAESAKLFKQADLNTQPTPDAWWELFNDPVLNDLQQQADRANPTVAGSIAAVQLAIAATATANASLWPTVGLTGSANKSNVQTTSNHKGMTYTAQGSVSGWEVDLWNRLGAAATSAKLKEDASRADLAAARLSLQASVAQTYFSIRAAEITDKSLGTTAEANQKFLTLTRNQYQSGVASSAAVASAESQLQSTLAQREESRITRATLEHALATLLGIAPGAFTLAPTGSLPPVPAVPLQLPSHLLERRPDIASAERKVAAANASIGAADAAFFPALMLSANYGARNTGLAGLFDLPNRIWSLCPSLTYGLFDGGARKAASASARAGYDQAVATYRQAVLTALQEVEDNLITASALQREEEVQRAALSAAHKATEVNTNQYAAGMVSYLNVISAQNAELAAQNSLVSVQSRRLTALAVLLKNLGGHWQPTK